MTMFTKADLVHDVAKLLGVHKVAVNEVLTEALALIAGAAAAGDGYRIAGFGTFQPRGRSARVGRNPRTGETVEIAAKTVLTFRQAKAGRPAKPAEPAKVVS